jgi:hypothetical protein
LINIVASGNRKIKWFAGAPRTSFAMLIVVFPVPQRQQLEADASFTS